MSWKFSLNNNWHDDLCEYYNVDAETALQLGTRAEARRPHLPGSETCEPVSNMTFEDIWHSKSRETTEDIFQFQKDLGAWSSFRQCVRHKDFTKFHMSILTPFIKEGVHICEYGCGVAPFSKTLLNNAMSSMSSTKISLSDVEGCEHLCFAEWRLKNQIEKNNLNVELNVCPITAHKLPNYSSKLDVVIVFEVLEHVYNPIKTVQNLFEYMNDNAIFVENFIKHVEGEQDDSDLESAAEERDDYYKFLQENFVLIGGPPEESDPNATRIWRKK